MEQDVDGTAGPPKEWPPAGMFLCPKEDCPRMFNSREELEDHQVSYENHAFCEICNIQFSSHEELFLHQLVSTRHHNCPICNRSFKCNAGRDYHIKIHHPEEQGLACPGCQKTFSSRKSYHSHIISNSCKSEAVLALNKHNERRERMRQILLEAAEDYPALVCAYSNDDDYRDGNNAPESLGDDDDIVSCGSDLSSPISMPVPLMTQKLDPDTPTTNSENSIPLPSPFALPISPDDLIAYDDDIYEDTWGYSSESATPQVSGQDGCTQNSQSTPPPALQEISNWDSEKHWNSESKRYFCECGFTTPYVKVFEQHVATERKKTRRSTCTHCGKNFNSIISLFAHIESDHVVTPDTSQKKTKPPQEAKNTFTRRFQDPDSPMDIGELDFQIYDRPPPFSQSNQRYRSKNNFGLRSCKVPRGTYW